MYFNLLHNDDTNNFNFVKVLIDLDEYINAITNFDWIHQIIFLGLESYNKTKKLFKIN